MKIHLQIEYFTRQGEDIRLQCDGWEQRMQTADQRLWTADLERDADVPCRMTYRYAMYRDDALVWTEWEAKPHTLDLHPGVAEYIVTDAWRPIPDDLPLYSSAYTDHLDLESETGGSCGDAAPQVLTITLRTTYPRLYAGERLAMMTSLNGWTEPLAMRFEGMHEWTLTLPADVAEYKFVIVAKGGAIVWEEGGNRRLPELPVSASRPATAVVTTVAPPRIERPEWRVAGIVVPVFSLRTARSQGVGDFADLLDMVRWAASVGMRAVQTLPINDTTATGTYADSYPYNAISCYALHPMYCDLSQLGYLADTDAQAETDAEARMLNALPQVDYVAVNKMKTGFMRRMYEQEGARTLRTKAYKQFVDDMREWLVPYCAYCYLRDQTGSTSPAQWGGYAKYSREAVEALWSGKPIATFPKPLPTGAAAIKKALHFYAYVQYVLHTQLMAVRDEAARLGVVLKGDIPIGVNRESVEVWTDPHLFHLNTSAGAPPDAFAAEGQNWGFPTYNWDMMAKDGYAWWRRRLTHMARYFNAYRIDHVLGFFRIWQIPTAVDPANAPTTRRTPTKAAAQIVPSGLVGQFAPSIPLYPDDFTRFGFRLEIERMTWPYQKDIDRALFVRDHHDIKLVHPRIGALDSTVFRELPDDQRAAYESLYNDYFYHRHNDFWYGKAMSKLPTLVQCTRMLVCAEDLGMVPDCVHPVMDQLRILSLEIQSMPKRQGLDFGVLADNPRLSVATIATHDMPTMRGWWREDRERAQLYWNRVLHHGGEAPRDMPAWLADDIIWRHLDCPSMLCLISLQDWLAADDTLRHPDPEAERINVPANPRHYWRYRMHLGIEQLAQARSFCDHVRQMIASSGR